MSGNSNPKIIFTRRESQEAMQDIIRMNNEILQSSPSPATSLNASTPEDVELVRRRNQLSSDLMSSSQQELQQSSTPETSSSRRSNSHTQLRGEKRKMFELMLSASHCNVDMSVVTSMFHISERYAKTLIGLYKKTGSLEQSQSKRGRKRIANREHLVSIRDMMVENNRLTDDQLASKLQTDFNLPKKPHRSTIQRIRMNHLHEIGDGVWTVKKWSPRGKNANSAANKRLRESVARDLIGSERHSLLKVFIDETHFEFHRQVGRAKSPAGTKAIVENAIPHVSFSAICAISRRGLEKCVILEKETVNADAFTIFFQNLVSDVGTRNCYFFMDNAPVHCKEKLEEIAFNNNHQLRFNAPYSPDLNPIENFFGLWKRRLLSMFENMKTVQDIRDCLQNSLSSIQEQEVVEIIDHVINKVSEQALAHETM